MVNAVTSQLTDTMPFIRRLAHSVMPSTDHTLGLGNSKSAMAAVNAMKRRQMAMWSPRNDKGGEGNATMTPEERLQHEIAVNDAIVDVFSAIIKETPRTLADSRHAPKNAKTTPSAKAKQNIHATGDNHKHNDSECTHKEHYYPIPEYAHTGEYEHDFHLSTATDKRELSPHSKKLRDEAFQRVCSGFTEGERFAHPPARGRQPSTPASSDKATATSSSIPTSKEVKIENVPPMIASSEPKPISDPMKLTRESKKTSENPKSAKASPLTTKLPSEKPVQAEGVRSGLNKSDTSSASLSTQKPETMTADEEYVPPHIRHLRRVKPEVLSAETPHGASKPTSRKASLPSSPKLDSSNTAGVSGEALPPHLRTVKHQNVGIKPKYSSTSSVSSLLGNVRKPEVKKQPLAAMPAEPVIPISTNKPSMEPSTKNTADVGTKPNSSWTSSPLGNASKPEVSQKPLAAMHAEPVIATPTSKSSTKSAADVGTKPTTSSTSSTSSSSSNARKFEVSQKPLDAVPVKPAILAPTNKPSTEPSTKKATGAAPVKEENLEHALYFGAWPKLAGRDAAGTFSTLQYNIFYWMKANVTVCYSFSSPQDYHYQAPSRFEAEFRCVSRLWRTS